MSRALAVKSKCKSKGGARIFTKDQVKNDAQEPGKRKKKDDNLLDMIPVRNCKWTRQEENKELVRIVKPRFDTKLGKSIGKKLKLKPTFNVNLDEYGTAVWRLFDGKLTVREIGEILRTQFGDTVEPLYERLAAFLKILKTNELIILQKNPAKIKHKKKIKS